MLTNTQHIQQFILQIPQKHIHKSGRDSHTGRPREQRQQCSEGERGAARNGVQQERGGGAQEGGDSAAREESRHYHEDAGR